MNTLISRTARHPAAFPTKQPKFRGHRMWNQPVSEASLQELVCVCLSLLFDAQILWDLHAACTFTCMCLCFFHLSAGSLREGNPLAFSCMPFHPSTRGELCPPPGSRKSRCFVFCWSLWHCGFWLACFVLFPQYCYLPNELETSFWAHVIPEASNVF